VTSKYSQAVTQHIIHVCSTGRDIGGTDLPEVSSKP
jgi:hypothetical protein